MIKGAYTAIITPFKTDGTLDEEGLRKNIRYQIESGIDGIVVLGTTGEASTLSWAEKENIIKIAREETLNKVHLMVGTGSNSTQTTIEQTQLAKQLGADSVLIVTPYYNKPTQEGIFRHFQAIAQNVNIPIMMYNIAGRCVINIETATLKRIAELPNVVGVKEASGNISQIQEVILNVARKRSGFSVMSGDDALTLSTMAHGGQGVISVASNLIPGEIKGLVKAALHGDFVHAQKHHEELLPLFKALFIETNPIPVKTAMRLWDMPAGGYRLPLCELLPENEQKLKEVLTLYRPCLC